MQPVTDTPDPAAEAVAYHLDELRRVVDLQDQTNRQTSGKLTGKVRQALATPTNDAALDHLVEAITALADHLGRLADWQRTDHGTIGDLRGETRHVSERIDQIEQTLRDHTTELAALTDTLDQLMTETRRLRARAERLQATPVTTGTPTTGPDDLPTSDPDQRHQPTLPAAALDDLYEDLEATFRGDRDHVTRLVEPYLDDVTRVGGPVLDIGCGRGEWLELLGAHRIDAYGVDLNDTFARANRDRGLDVRTGDAIAHLAGLTPGSLGVITGFHLAEHLPFEVLVELADRALAALRPGGLLILESPDPTNVRVGAAQFWIDPTHIRPLHPRLLQFVLTQRGFAHTEIRPLHPAAHHDTDWATALGIEPTDTGAAILEEIRAALTGPMDYAVIGTAGGSTLD